jgi:hypothetical protein
MSFFIGQAGKNLLPMAHKIKSLTAIFPVFVAEDTVFIYLTSLLLDLEPKFYKLLFLFSHLFVYFCASTASIVHSFIAPLPGSCALRSSVRRLEFNSYTYNETSGFQSKSNSFANMQLSRFRFILGSSSRSRRQILEEVLKQAQLPSARQELSIITAGCSLVTQLDAYE